MADRGERTRQQLVSAGLDLLTEGGWVAVTSRAVADRSGVNVGLIHYHFGGMPGLRVAIAQAATDALIGELHAAVVEASGPEPLVLALTRSLRAAHDAPEAGRLAAALFEGAIRDPDIAASLRDALRDARHDLAVAIGGAPPLGTGDATATAVLVTALTDGLLMHLLVDPDLDVEPALQRLRRLLAGPDEP